MNRWMGTAALGLKIILPLVTVSVCALAAWLLILTKPKAPERDVVNEAPAVQAVEVDRRPVAFSIRSQGQVLPRTATMLAAQVSGRIVQVADAVKNSGFFKAGDVLVKIDPRDYEVQIRRLEALLAAARAKQEEASREFERSQSLTERNAIAQSAFDQAEATRDVARAEIARLQAELETAEHSLSDTSVVAPFDGCVEEQKVDLGQYVTVGTPLVRCFATDSAEIRLPLTDEQFGYLDIPLGKTLAEAAGPGVRLEADFAGSKRSWHGRIVRSEPVVDAKSRMVYLVARVEQPYSESTRSGGQPMAVGMFVDAAVEVPARPGSFALPAPCVTADGRLFVIDEKNRLDPQSVRVLHRDTERVVVAGGLESGQRVCATRLDYAVAGMPVRVVEQYQKHSERPESGGTTRSASHQVRAGGGAQ